MRRLGVGFLVLAASCGDTGDNRANADAGTGISSVSIGEEGSSATDPQSGTGTSATSPTADDSDVTSASAQSDSEDVKFDLAASPDAPGDCSGKGSYDFSYIWIANTNQGTVSKINTVTGVEEGRYWIHPGMGPGSPSRTSVNLQGDVAVSNRDPGGVTRIAANANCEDRNGNGMIDSSTGPADILDWGTDECVMWHIDVPSPEYNHGPRPTAWEGGNVSEETCELVETPRLWIGYKDAAGNGIFWRLDGDDGSVLDIVDAGPWGVEFDYGPYGGAVNAEGDLIATGLDRNPAVHIDGDTLAVTDLGDSGGCKYGMGLDQNGDVWVGGCFGEGVYHFRFSTMSWSTITNLGGTRVNGVQVDRDGNVWGAGGSPCRVVQIDAATEAVIRNDIAVPGCGGDPRGISIDRDGYVWLVDMTSNQAFKIDPINYDTEITVTGLIYPYTYSDMTGSGLNLVVNPPG